MAQPSGQKLLQLRVRLRHACLIRNTDPMENGCILSCTRLAFCRYFTQENSRAAKLPPGSMPTFCISSWRATT